MITFTTDLFEEINRVRDELNQIFRTRAEHDGYSETAYPATNVYKNGDDLAVVMMLPGVTAENLEINYEKGVLNVSGKKDVEIDENKNYIRAERGSGSFSKSLRVGDDIDPDSIVAKYTDGVLEIKLSKREEAKPRKISIN